MNQRLIDANKIEFNTVRYPIGAPWPFNKEEQATMGEFEYVSKYQIDNQPIAEAIPIEWIIKYIKDHTQRMVDPKYDGRYFTEEPLDYYVDIKPYQVEKMLEAWEKENG